MVELANEPFARIELEPALREHRDADSARIPMTRREEVDGQERTDPGLGIGLEKVHQIEACEAAAFGLGCVCDVHLPRCADQ